MSDRAAVAAIARIVMASINSLRNQGGGRGVAAICASFGRGDAVMPEAA